MSINPNVNQEQWSELMAFLAPKAMALLVIALFIAIVMYLPGTTDKSAEEADIPLLTEGQEYTLSEMIEKQTAGTVYLLREDGTPVMGNVRFSQVEDGNILTGVTYHPKQFVLVASYRNNKEMVQEQLMEKRKYPNAPSNIFYSLFGRHGELEIDAWAMELTIPEGTETIRIYPVG